MTKDEALKLALKALENTYALRDDVAEAITAVKQALAAPVQEPVAWSVAWEGVHCGNFFFREGDAIEHRERLSLKFPNEKREVVPLYTALSASPEKGQS